MAVETKIKVSGIRLFDKSLMEKKKHGTEDLPVQFYESAFIDYDRFSTHWHKEIEVINVLSGNVIVKINHQSFDLSEGDFAVVNKGALHSLHKDPATREVARFKTLIFDLYLLTSVLREYCQRQVVEKVDENTLVLNRIIKNGSENHLKFQTYYNAISKSYDEKLPNYQIEIRGYLHLLVNVILNEKTNLDTLIRQRPKINISKAIDVINRNIEVNYTIYELAKTIGYTEAYLMREFKKSTGMTVTEYINKTRINYAKNLLSNTDDTIMDIAANCGFNNASYFNKRFKKELNMTPFEYRKSHRS